MKLIIRLSLVLFLSGCSNTGGKDESKNQDTTKVSNPEATGPAGEGDSSNIAFGFSNESGNQILITSEDSLANPSKFSATISKDGKIAETSYNNQKVATKDDNGRQIYYNFSNSGGYLFDVKTGTVSNENSVILFSKDFLAGKKFIELNAIETKDIPGVFNERVEKDKGRKVIKDKVLVHLDKDRSIYLFEFTIKADSALVSLALITPDKIIYKDFPAKVDATSTWRVDDGGDFGFDYYKVLAVFEKNNSLGLITDWLGTEGYSIEYMKEDGQQFKEVKKGYRYTAAE